MSEPHDDKRASAPQEQSVIDLAHWRAAHGRTAHDRTAFGRASSDRATPALHAPSNGPEPQREDRLEDHKDAPALARLSGVSWIRGGQRVLDRVDLALHDGGVSTVIGPNGAGKSVMLRLMSQLLTPSEGAVAAPPSGQNGTVLVFQKPVLLRRTLRQNLLHALRLARVPRIERPAALDALMAAGGLSHLADRPARTLSGGEQQRAAMMRALAFRPRLLMLDEPSANLDPHATAAIEDLIRGAVRSGVKVLLVTHDLGQARRLASEIIVLDRGRIAEETAVNAFFERPASAAGRAYRDGRLHL